MRIVAVSMLSLLVVLFSGVSGVGAVEYETPSSRVVSDILPPDVISGPHYRIRDKVVSYGYMYRYTVDSDFGVFEVTGDGALRKLLGEIKAIAALKKMSEEKEYLEAVKNAGLQPVEFGKNLITDPVDTVSGIPKGVFRLFSDIGTSITTKQDPSEDSRIKAALAVSSYKRDLGYELGVDVYSSNKVLQKELNRFAWAGALGSLSVSAALAPFGGPAILAVKMTRLSQQFNEILKQEPPSRLRQINEEKLLAMGVSTDLAKQYLDHPAFTPRHDTILVGSLAALGNARGRDAFIQFALAAENEVDANFFQNMAETMRGYHETVSPIQEIAVIDILVFARAANGSVLIPFPLDHGVWSERTDRVITSTLAAYKASGAPPAGKFELWIAGTVTPLARHQLGLRGIQVTENVDERVMFMD